MIQYQKIINDRKVNSDLLLKFKNKAIMKLIIAPILYFLIILFIILIVNNCVLRLKLNILVATILYPQTPVYRLL